MERKHHHIVESGLALLYHANIPLHFWDDAFQTACYLINRLPTLTLKNKSLFETLFASSLEYSLLKNFGCACWPNLYPYNSNKLQPRSIQCVFLGYSIRHKGYKCFHVPSSRLYISRDVVFQESLFLFQIPNSSLTTHGSQNPIPPNQSSILRPHPSMIQQMTSTGLFNNSMAPNQAQHTSQASPQAHHTSHNQPTVATFSPRPSPITSIETLTSSSQTITPLTSLEPPPSTSPTPDSPIHPNPLQLIPCSHDPKTTLPNLSFQLTAQSVILFQRH